MHYGQQGIEETAYQESWHCPKNHSVIPAQSGKAEIEVREADDLYKEIRIENTLQDSKGKKVKFKKGADVDLTIETDEKDTTPKE